MVPTTAMKPRLELEQPGEAPAVSLQFWLLSLGRRCRDFLPLRLGVESGVGRPDSSPSACDTEKQPA